MSLNLLYWMWQILGAIVTIIIVCYYLMESQKDQKVEIVVKGNNNKVRIRK